MNVNELKTMHFIDFMPQQYRDSNCDTSANVKHLELDELGLKEILEYEIRYPIAEPQPANPLHADAVVFVERELSDCYGCQYTDRHDLCGYSSHLFGASINPEHYFAINFWTVVAYELDDYFDHVVDKTKLVEWCNNYEAGAWVPVTKEDRALMKAIWYINKYLNNKQAARFHQIYIEYLRAYVTLFEFNFNKLLTYEEFFRIREDDVAMTPMFAWSELAVGFDPNEHGLWENPLFVSFINAGSYFAALINDLYSFKKEVCAGKFKHAYMYVIMAREGCTAQQAADRIVGEAKDAWTFVLDYSQKLMDLNVPGLGQYVDQVKLACEGSHYWAIKCGRYNSWNK